MSRIFFSFQDVSLSAKLCRICVPESAQCDGFYLGAGFVVAL
ncbi:hypothetical protein [Anaplasma phagocytophilum]